MMATTIYELRKKPQLLFNLCDTDFHLIDDDKPSNNGGYKYNSITSIKLVKGKTNWIVSIFSLIVDLIFDFSSFSNYKEKDKLIIETKNSKIEILLFKVDKKEVEALVLNLNKLVNK